MTPNSHQHRPTVAFVSKFGLPFGYPNKLLRILRKEAPGSRFINISHAELSVKTSGAFSGKRPVGAASDLPIHCTVRATLNRDVSNKVSAAEKVGIPCFNSSTVSVATTDKAFTHELAEGLGIPTPQTRKVRVGEADTALICGVLRRTPGEVVVVKPNRGRKSRRIRYFDNRAVERIKSYIQEHPLQGEFLIQEYLGRVTCKAWVCVTRDGNYKCCAIDSRLRLGRTPIGMALPLSLSLRILGDNRSDGVTTIRDEIARIATTAAAGLRDHLAGMNASIPGLLVVEVAFRAIGHTGRFQPVLLEMNSMPGRHLLRLNDPQGHKDLLACVGQALSALSDGSLHQEIVSRKCTKATETVLQG
jgi:hypothetical protein